MDSENTKSRKSILLIVGVSIIGIIAFPVWKILKTFGIRSLSERRGRLVMLMDLDKCIGCNACSVACKAENGVALGGFRTRVLEKEYGEYPEVRRYFLPVMCNHCKDAPCLQACTNKAIVRRKDGIVNIDKEKCKGFGLCIAACPYGAIYMNPDLEPSQQVAKYPSRQLMKSDKCNFCLHRIDEGLEPACSNTCPTNARIFGDLSDETSLVYQIVKEEKLTGLLEEKGTWPQVFYRGGNKAIFHVEKSINKREE